MSACKAKTKAGKACKAAALKGSDRCAVHSQPGTKGTAKKARRDWRPAFLDALEEIGTVTGACEAAKVGRRTVYKERQRNEDFALAWADIEERVVEGLSLIHI